MAKQPCKRDCPERSGECHASCERWKKYEAERNSEYELIRKEKAQYYDMYEFEANRKRDIATGKLRRRRSK